MKRKFAFAIAVCLMLTAFVGCSNNEGTESSGGSEVVETQKDYMEEYVSKLEDSGSRVSFLSFWNSMCTYCRGLEIKLREIENTKTFEFDPTEESSIPEELKELYDFSKINYYSGVETHKNYTMKVVGETVEFSFDDETFYPTSYGYTDVKTLVDKYNAE